MNLAPHQDPAVITIGLSVLEQIRELCPSLVYASILTDDGFQVVEVEGARSDGNRFASMASSIQALSEAVTRELSIGTNSYVVIAAQNGHVIQLRVPDQSLVLAALFDTYETLGKALSVTRMAASQMSEQLASHNTIHGT